jgi:hypothetical protein
MGFWGTFIVTRAEQPLAELPALGPSADKIDWQQGGHDGWQVVQVHDGPAGWAAYGLPAAWEGTLRALMEQSGHPVIAATILDSDCGQLIGYSPKAGRWGGWLDLKMALQYMDRTVSDGDDGSIWWDEDGQVHSPNGEITDDQRERYQRRYDAALAHFLTIGPDAEGATPLAIAWALEAGLQPDAAAVLAALKGEEVFAEDQFFNLLTALGIPRFTSDDASE